MNKKIKEMRDERRDQKKKNKDEMVDDEVMVDGVFSYQSIDEDNVSHINQHLSSSHNQPSHNQPPSNLDKQFPIVPSHLTLGFGDEMVDKMR